MTRLGYAAASLDQVAIALLVATGVGYYVFWHWTERRNARRLRHDTSKTSHEAFIRDSLFEKNHVPAEYALAFVQFFEEAYGLRGRSLIEPSMTLDDISSISPDSPMADDIEVAYLLKKLEKLDESAANALRRGTIAEAIVACWKLGIDSPRTR